MRNTSLLFAAAACLACSSSSGSSAGGGDAATDAKALGSNQDVGSGLEEIATGGDSSASDGAETVSDAASPGDVAGAGDATPDVSVVDSHDGSAADASEVAPTDTGSGGDASGPACKPKDDSGCQSGFKCVYDNSDVIGCVPAGAVKTGDLCKANEDCATGVCITFANNDMRCTPYCIEVSSMSSCPDGAQCSPVKDHAWKVCDEGKYATCDPLKQDCPTATDGCYSTSTGFVCLPAGSVDVKGNCASANDCKKGMACIGSGATGTSNFCRPMCDPTKPLGQNGCPSATTACSKISNIATVGYCGD